MSNEQVEKVARLKMREYHNRFRSWADVCENFGIDEPEPDRVFAVYDTPSYEGYATVVFRRGRQWFHASGSHCSCYGLEGQWKPEPFLPRDQFAALKQGKNLIDSYAMRGAEEQQFHDWLRKMSAPRKPPPPDSKGGK